MTICSYKTKQMRHRSVSGKWHLNESISGIGYKCASVCGSSIKYWSGSGIKSKNLTMVGFWKVGVFSKSGIYSFIGSRCGSDRWKDV